LEIGALDQIEKFHTRLKSGDVKPDALLCNALGYKPLTAYINGDITKEDAIEKGQAETRRYAKRQTTWFRHQIKEGGTISVQLLT